MNFDQAMKAYYKERDELGIGKQRKEKGERVFRPLHKRLADKCRCGHTLEFHDFGAEFTQPCLKSDCPCQNFRRVPEQPAE